MTRVFGILGHPVEHSLSPRMHRAAFEALGLDAVYAPFDVAPRDLGHVLRGLRVAGVDGLNVTVPHKQRVLAYLSGLTPQVRLVGAANTIVREGNRLIGHNTDVEGFRLAIREELRVDCRGKRVVLLGAGGAARAVGVALMDLAPSALLIANRTQTRGRVLVKWLARLGTARRRGGRPTMDVAAIEPRAVTRAVKQADILINATSLGLHADDPMPVDPAALHPRLAVVDLVYARPTTRLVQEARRRGALAIDGLAMLVYQGAESFRLWWGRRPPVEAMRRAVERAMQTSSRP